MATLVLLAAGCGAGTSAPVSSPAVGDATKVDMCAILTNPELSQLGIDLDSREPENRVGVVGCGWVGKPITLTLARARDNIAWYRSRQNDPAFTSFALNTVNGRDGVQAGDRSDHSQCVQFMDGGPVSVVVSVAQASSLGPKIDPCAEALRIAQMVEPRLPKAGS